MKKILYFFLISLCLMATTKELKINSTPEYEGIELIEKLKNALELSFSNIGFKTTFTDFPNLRGLEEANKGNIDGEFPRAKTITDNYENLFYINIPLFRENFFAYSVEKKYNTWKEIEGKKIGIHLGAKVPTLVITNNTKKTEIFSLKGRTALYQMLESRRVDLLFLPEQMGDKIIEENNSSFILKGDKVLYEDNFYLLLNKKHLILEPLIETELKKNLKY